MTAQDVFSGKESMMIHTKGIAIYEDLKEIVEPGHSCLVVWDVQNGLVDKIFNKEEFLGNTKRFVESLRNIMPVVYTLITPLPREFQSSWGMFNMMRRYNVKEVDKLPHFMSPGSQEREIPEAVKPAKGDILLDKATASIFIGTNFENMMRNRRIATLIFTGIATEAGIESSARDASNRGFYPVVVSDCVSSMDRDAHERSLKNLEKVAIVKNSADILKSVAEAD
jgi:nicotinamidase-related amidase